MSKFTVLDNECCALIINDCQWVIDNYLKILKWRRNHLFSETSIRHLKDKMAFVFTDPRDRTLFLLRWGIE